MCKNSQVLIFRRTVLYVRPTYIYEYTTKQSRIGEEGGFKYLQIRCYGEFCSKDLAAHDGRFGSPLPISREYDSQKQHCEMCLNLGYLNETHVDKKCVDYKPAS